MSDRNKPCICGSGIKAKKCPCRNGAAMIVQHDHPALSTVSDPVMPGDDLSFLSKMERACRSVGNGVGLAANQIGVTKRAIFVCENRMRGFFMLNPVVSWKSDSLVTGNEGCLSYPGVNADISRPDHIIVLWQDTGFNPREAHFHGFGARIVLHETDHLDGVCQVGDA